MTILKTILTKAAAEYNKNHDVKLAKRSEHGDYNLGAGIYKDSSVGEFIVFFVDGGEYLSKADYCTNLLEDAARTVASFLYPHQGEPLTAPSIKLELGNGDPVSRTVREEVQIVRSRPVATTRARAHC